MTAKQDKAATASEEKTEQEFLQAQVEAPPAPEPAPPPPPSAEQQNIYEQRTSSTEVALISPEDFWKIKLSN